VEETDTHLQGETNYPLKEKLLKYPFVNEQKIYPVQIENRQVYQ
jgi:hypothetical protein